MRNNAAQTALPMRDYGSFLPGNGVGGAGVHWNGYTWRFWPSDFQIKTPSHPALWRRASSKNLQLQDWGVTWDEIEHCFDKFEYLCGISGKAGNLKGQIQPGGNPFEGPRSREYPNPPLKMPYASTLFAEAATELGFHPFPLPASNLSQALCQSAGRAHGPMQLLRLSASVSAAPIIPRPAPQTTILPVLMKKPNFEVRTECEVLKVNLMPDGKTAKSVTYVDTHGRGI